MGETAEAPVYNIETVADFRLIPRDRLDICLREFRIWIEMGHAAMDLMQHLPVKWPAAFVWVDDDKHTMAVSVTDGTTKIPLASGVMKGFGA